MLRLLALLIILGAQAQAGAWPREKGKTFLSFSTQIEGPNEFGLYDTFATVYGEYGLTEKLTLGIDLGGSAVEMTKAIAFARLPIGHDTRETKLAIELGIGQVGGNTALRPGLSIGRGLTLGDRHGWATIDTRFVLFKGRSGHLLESDATLGLNATDKIKLIVQLQTGAPKGDPLYMRLAPSVVIEKKPGHHLEFGVTAGLLETSEMGIKIGSWRNF